MESGQRGREKVGGEGKGGLDELCDVSTSESFAAAPLRSMFPFSSPIGKKCVCLQIGSYKRLSIYSDGSVFVVSAVGSFNLASISSQIFLPKASSSRSAAGTLNTMRNEEKEGEVALVRV